MAKDVEWKRGVGAQKNAAECRALLSIYVNNFIEAPHTHTQSCLPEGQREQEEEGREEDVHERAAVKARAAAGRAEAAICQVVSDRYIDKIELGFGDCTKVTEQISAAS